MNSMGLFGVWGRDHIWPSTASYSMEILQDRKGWNRDTYSRVERHRGLGGKRALYRGRRRGMVIVEERKDKRRGVKKQTSVTTDQAFHNHIHIRSTHYSFTCVYTFSVCSWIAGKVPPSFMAFGVNLQAVCWYSVSCDNTAEVQKKKYCSI